VKKHSEIAIKILGKGFYPTPSGTEAFNKELSLYKAGEGPVQFPIEKPIPYDLVKRIVLFRINENQEKKK
jgi:uncharacterized protein YdhG (YjbR/CyaY superfamily)